MPVLEVQVYHQVCVARDILQKGDCFVYVVGFEKDEGIRQVKKCQRALHSLVFSGGKYADRGPERVVQELSFQFGINFGK